LGGQIDGLTVVTTRVAGDALCGAAFWKLMPCRRMIKYEALE